METFRLLYQLPRPGIRQPGCFIPSEMPSPRSYPVSNASTPAESSDAGERCLPATSSIRQSVFYTKTPGHHPYLLNHWIVSDKSTPDLGQPPDDAFKANLSLSVKDPDLFWTSHPRSAWRISQHSPSGDQLFYGLPPSMPDANYWIVTCGSALIKDHNDVWSDTAMEMYAGVFRACELRRRRTEQ